jgi:hypothetical protein
LYDLWSVVFYGLQWVPITKTRICPPSNLTLVSDEVIHKSTTCVRFVWTLLIMLDITPKTINTKSTTSYLYSWWFSGKCLRLRCLFSLWSQVQVLWLLIWWPLEAYMVVNFRARGISQGARKLVRTPTLN